METTIINNGLYAKLKTSKGDIIIKLEYKKTPLTVANFVGLAEGTISFKNRNAARYYDGLTFHRVIENFMIQTGCPFGNGTGGPGYCFSDEFHPDLKHANAGILSMANKGVDTNGSQFFITHKATPHLDGKYTVFGKVVKGLETVNSITQGDKIDCIQILRIGEDAKDFRVTQAMFDRLAKEVAKKNELAKKKKLENDIKFIETKWPDVIKSVSGLMFIIIKKGSGGSPVYGDKVIVHYEGSLLNGTVFDSSIKRGEPATIEIGKVIVGWNLALVKMKKGEKRLIIIPPQLGYGEKGVPGVIPSNSFLVFEVELIDFIH